ncbi:UDP-N-acetylmuramate dehydrogenase [Candidatus Saccharibacteria bacterium]|nr:UDP-N-acetylmuramate dehydrogenase [Candidatus Saccharibacteria bacterium]
MKIRENVPISELTTMRLGGAARYVIEVESEDEVAKAWAFAAEKELPVYVLGCGSNIIGRDGGFNGVILVNKIMGMGIAAPEANGMIDLYANSGELLDDFVTYGTQMGFSGMEALSAIPGTVGAAPVQNVGAYGQDIAQTLVSVRAYDNSLKKIVELPASDLDLSYRHSIFNSGDGVGRYFITQITVRLARKELKPPFYTSLQKYIEDNQVTDFSPESIRKAVRAVREAKLPDPVEIASAGSFFKNVYLKTPEEIADAEKRGIPVWDGGKIPSGWLIEHAGLKGQVFHGMRVSDKASLVLINEDAKNYADLAAARKEIIEIVREKFGFTLEQEPMELGE